MTELKKLLVLLDEPESQALLYGLAHVRSAAPPAQPGASRLHAVVVRLADMTDTEQYRSWLSDDAPNRAMTVDQVRRTIGDDAVDDLAHLAGGSSIAVAAQLAALLPDFVDAVSPGGQVLDTRRIAEAIDQAVGYDERSAGAFGSWTH
jgi:uncharacterized protein YidB (DUF937 family)